MKNNFLDTRYINFFGIRFVFCNDGNRWRYHGWYHKNLKEIV